MIFYFLKGRFALQIVGLLLLSCVAGVFEPCFTSDPSLVAANVVEEVESDAEEFRHDEFRETVFYEASQVWQPVCFWTLHLSDRPRLGVDDAFFEPQLQRPPPA
jgi:hypothetical protein